VRRVIAAVGVPWRVLINNWDPRDDELDLNQPRAYLAAMRFPAFNTMIRQGTRAEAPLTLQASAATRHDYGHRSATLLTPLPPGEGDYSSAVGSGPLGLRALGQTWPAGATRAIRRVLSEHPGPRGADRRAAPAKLKGANSLWALHPVRSN
jgi:hypothetical protein